MEFQPPKAARKNQVAQIAEEHSRPGRKFDQKPRNRPGV
jgi:hypothetical protein